MAIKTVSLRVEAYQRLTEARSFPGESFSQVIMRAHWQERSMTATELLARYAQEGPHFTLAELADMDEALADDRPPQDKWTTR